MRLLKEAWHILNIITWLVMVPVCLLFAPAELVFGIWSLYDQAWKDALIGFGGCAIFTWQAYCGLAHREYWFGKT